jgi:CHRD domain-containing protein
MKKPMLAAAALLALAPAVHAEEDGRVIRTILTGYQEVPSVSTLARGRLKVDIHPDGNAFDWELNYSGLQGTVQQAHIHFARRGVNGAIVVWLCGTPQIPGPAGTQTCPESGVITGTATTVDGPGAATQQLTTGEAIREVIAAMRAGAAYANVHTNLSPGGEIRGQIGGRGTGDDHHH